MTDSFANEFLSEFIITRTPFRISLAGGGTDLAEFYEANKYGAVLSFAIDKYVYVTLKQHGELFDERIRLNYSEVELVSTVNEIRNDIARCCLQLMRSKKRTYVSTVSDLPAASGLGSSSSFAVGFLNALYTARGMNVSAGRLADDACKIEIDLLNSPIGRQDAYPSAFGGLNFVKFEPGGLTTVQPIFPSSGMDEFGKSLLLFWTGIQRKASDVLTEQRSKTIENRNSSQLVEIRALAEDLRSHFQGHVRPEYVGRALHEGWKLKRELSSGVSSSKIDEWYAAAIDAGAFGGKICGAGGGGFLFLVAEESRHKHICEALRGLSRIPVGFDNKGSQVLFPNT